MGQKDEDEISSLRSALSLWPLPQLVAGGTVACVLYNVGFFMACGGPLEQLFSFQDIILGSLNGIAIPMAAISLLLTARRGILIYGENARQGILFTAGIVVAMVGGIATGLLVIERPLLLLPSMLFLFLALIVVPFYVFIKFYSRYKVELTILTFVLYCLSSGAVVGYTIRHSNQLPVVDLISQPGQARLVRFGSTFSIVRTAEGDLQAIRSDQIVRVMNIAR